MSIGKCLPSGNPSGQLVIILGWMGAKDQHIEKYRRLYYQRGFDVLTCKTSTYDLLVKVDAVKKNAEKLIDCLDQHILPVYSDIIVHAFSVGAYYWCELITELNKVKTKEQIENGIQKHLKGMKLFLIPKTFGNFIYFQVQYLIQSHTAMALPAAIQLF